MFRIRPAMTGLFLSFLVSIAGCKTSQDAAAAATQMSTTAKGLRDYYAALSAILTETDALHSLNEQLYSKPYSAENRKELKTTQSELDARVKLAGDLSTFADDFAKLSGATAPADVAAAGNNLETEVDSLASYKASTGEQTAVKAALQVLVTAIQERKEREAAQGMDSLASGLSSLFDKEAPAWNSVDSVYLQLAATLARDLSNDNAVDYSPLLKPALDPFGLTPLASSANLNAKLAPLVEQQIAARLAEQSSSYSKATDAMSKSLQEMSQRIHLVAADKPMAFRAAPITVATVEQWATQAASY